MAKDSPYDVEKEGGRMDDERQVYVVFLENSDKAERNAFIRKVFLILFVQLFFSLGVIMIFKTTDGPRMFVLKYPWLMWVAFGIVLVMGIAMSCCETPRKRPPWNWICLTLFTAAESFLLGVSSLRYSFEIVLIAVGAAAAVCLVIIIFAMQTKWDFTGCGIYLLVLAVIMLIMGVCMIFFGHDKTFKLVYASIGLVIGSFFLIYNVQLMLGGNHKRSLGTDEHVYAALTLYTDIINIFSFLLMIIGSGDK